MNLINNNIILRAINSKDAELLHEMINDSRIEEFILGWSFPVSMQQQLKWIDNLNNNEPKFIIEVNEVSIGMASISNLDFKNSTANLNIKIKDSEFKQKGIGTQVINILIDYCFNELNLNCLTASILEYNLSSIKLFEKCNFKREGILRSRIFKKGKYHNVYIYSLIRKEYNI